MFGISPIALSVTPFLLHPIARFHSFCKPISPSSPVKALELWQTAVTQLARSRRAFEPAIDLTQTKTAFWKLSGSGIRIPFVNQADRPDQ